MSSRQADSLTEFRVSENDAARIRLSRLSSGARQGRIQNNTSAISPTNELVLAQWLELGCLHWGRQSRCCAT